MRISPTWFAAITLTACLAGAGCASKNYSTTLVTHPHGFDGLEARFRIDHIDTVPPIIFYMSGFTDSDYWAEEIKDAAGTEDFPRQLRGTLTAKHPGLFADAPDALPVNIRFTVAEFHESSNGSSMLASLTWGMFGIILPLPIVMHYDCTLEIEIPALAIRQSTAFHNRLAAWISFPSPLALIPVPASADRRACGMHPLQSTYYSGRLFTLEIFSEAVVQAIEKIDPTAINEAYRTRNAAAHHGTLQ